MKLSSRLSKMVDFISIIQIQNVYPKKSYEILPKIQMQA